MHNPKLKLPSGPPPRDQVPRCAPPIGSGQYPLTKYYAMGVCEDCDWETNGETEFIECGVKCQVRPDFYNVGLNWVVTDHEKASGHRAHVVVNKL